DHTLRPFVIRGNGIMLSGGMAVDGIGVDSVEVDIVLTNAQTFFVRDGPRVDYLRLRGVISGSADATLIKTGSGTLALYGANSYAGGTTLAQGEIELNNSTALGTGQVTVLGGFFRNEVRLVPYSFMVRGSLVIYQPDPSLDSNFTGDFNLAAPLAVNS